MTGPQQDRTTERALDGLSFAIDLIDLSEVLLAAAEFLCSLFASLH